MKLSEEEARLVAYEDHKDFEQVERDIVDSGRWTIQYNTVVKHTPTGKHYLYYHSEGATEYQEREPFEYEGTVEFLEVEQKEVKTMQWVRVEVK